MDDLDTQPFSSIRMDLRARCRWARVGVVRAASTCIRWLSDKQPRTTVRPTTSRVKSTWPRLWMWPPGYKQRRPAAWPQLRRPSADDAVVARGARDGTRPRRPRTKAAVCCTWPTATTRNRRRPPAGGGATAVVAPSPEVPPTSRARGAGGDGPVVAADAVAADGDGDGGGGDNRRLLPRPRAGGHRPSTNRSPRPVEVRRRTRHRCIELTWRRGRCGTPSFVVCCTRSPTRSLRYRFSEATVVSTWLRKSAWYIPLLP